MLGTHPGCVPQNVPQKRTLSWAVRSVELYLPSLCGVGKEVGLEMRGKAKQRVGHAKAGSLPWHRTGALSTHQLRPQGRSCSSWGELVSQERARGHTATPAAPPLALPLSTHCQSQKPHPTFPRKSCRL